MYQLHRVALGSSPTSVGRYFHSLIQTLHLLSGMNNSQSPRPPLHDVMIIGAGPAGLMAARVLLNHGLSILVLEGRMRKGGRAFSYSIDECGSARFADIANAAPSSTGDSLSAADLGCSSIRGVKDSGNSIMNMALYHNATIPKVLGGVLQETTSYESTKAAPWFRRGRRLSQKIIVRMHLVYDAILARIASYATS